MKNTEGTKRLKSNSRHFTKILLIEYGYCLLVFFVFTFFALKRNLDLDGISLFSMAYYKLILIPTVYNIYQIIVAKRDKHYARMNNYIIVGLLVIMLCIENHLQIEMQISGSFGNSSKQKRRQSTNLICAV